MTIKRWAAFRPQKVLFHRFSSTVERDAAAGSKAIELFMKTLSEEERSAALSLRPSRDVS
jgi:hypothetical protein